MKLKLILKERLFYIRYTWRHKIAFLKVEKKVRGKNTLRGLLHDADKLFLYALPFIDIQTAQNIHTKYARHHLRNNIQKTQKDIEETVIDWACAPLTKPDKPLNAYQTLIKYYPNHVEQILPTIKKWFPEQIKKNNLKSKERE